MKIRPEIEVPDGRFCFPPGDMVDPCNYYISRRNPQTAIVTKFCALFRTYALDVEKSIGGTKRNVKCQQCLDACQEAEKAKKK